MLKIMTMCVLYVGEKKYKIPVDGRVTTQQFILNIYDDIVECNETVNVAIVSITSTTGTTCGATIGSNNISEVMITDDDGKHKFIMIISVMSENII